MKQDKRDIEMSQESGRKKKVELNVEEGKSEGKADAVLECDGTITRKHDVIPISRTNQARRVIALILSIICSNN